MNQDQSLKAYSSSCCLFLLGLGYNDLKRARSSETVNFPIDLLSSLSLISIVCPLISSFPTTPIKLTFANWAFLIFFSSLSPLLSIEEEYPSSKSLLLTFSTYYWASLPMGMRTNWRGETQNGHLPPVCSHRIAIIRSTDPRIALWIITGLANPFFTSLMIAYSK